MYRDRVCAPRARPVRTSRIVLTLYTRYGYSYILCVSVHVHHAPGPGPGPGARAAPRPLYGFTFLGARGAPARGPHSSARAGGRGGGARLPVLS